MEEAAKTMEPKSLISTVKALRTQGLKIAALIELLVVVRESYKEALLALQKPLEGKELFKAKRRRATTNAFEDLTEATKTIPGTNIEMGDAYPNLRSGAATASEG